MRGTDPIKSTWVYPKLILYIRWLVIHWVEAIVQRNQQLNALYCIFYTVYVNFFTLLVCNKI